MRSLAPSAMRTEAWASAASKPAATASTVDVSYEALDIMIGRLAGVLIEKNPPQILIDAHGVGYEVEVPMSTFYVLPATGERVTLLTHLVVREDAQLLYGFASEGERRAFRQLLKISGVGARTSLALLSGLSVSELAEAVMLQEAGRLVKVPGIGKKTAERLLLELKGKLGGDVVVTAETPAGRS